MGNKQGSKPEVAKQEVKTSPQQEAAQEEVKQLHIEIPKTGPNAYDYDENDSSQKIGSGGFGFVLRGIRYYDK